MSRRLFLQRAAALIGVIVTPAARATAHKLAEPQHIETATRSTSTRKVELQRSPVAGFQYHQGEAVWSLLTVGASLSLVREADNAYDPRAVRVDWRGQKLGYVSRVDNAAVSHLLDTGHALDAEIVTLRDSDNPWKRIEFAVFLPGG